MKYQISIIICCHNSEERILETLSHIAQQELIYEEVIIEAELVLVNNNSTDNTVDLVKDFWSRISTDISINIVDEPIPGLINARIRGVKKSRFDLIIFCDDDNWLAKDYLKIACNIMSNNSKIGALGGKGQEVSNVKFPDWFDQYKDGYACGVQMGSDGVCTSRGFLWGAGLVSRKEILIKVLDKRSPFLLTGRKEKTIISGDDAEICLRIILLGFDLYYTSKLNYQHFISSNRLSLEYKKKLWLGFDAAKKILLLYKYEIIRRKGFVYIITNLFNSIMVKGFNYNIPKVIHLNYFKLLSNYLKYPKLRNSYAEIREFNRTK